RQARMRSAMWQNQARSSDIGDGLQQSGRSVQRLGAPQAHPQLCRKFTENNVDVVQNFNVIAEKTDGLNQYTTVALCFELSNGVLNRRTKPRTSRHSLALKRK